MRSTSDSDITTRARIRDAAITAFGEHGFGVGVRAIATAANVSPGLVNHHFGSKEGLRAACDEQVLEIIRAEKEKTLTTPSGAGILDALSEIEAYAPVVAYMVRSFSAGGPLAESLLEHMIDDAVQYMEAGVAAGTLKPSHDPRARARYIVLCHTGAMTLYLRMRAEREGKLDYRIAIRELADEITFPALELYAQGMLTDSSILEKIANDHRNA